MNLVKIEVELLFNDWLNAWNEHNIEGVMKLFHNEVIFENWLDHKVVGKDNLKKVWIPWFKEHGNFKFIEEDIFFDESEQKMLFMWRLEWPSLLKEHFGKNEVRRGVDILYFLNGKIVRKCTYSKTSILIDGISITL